MEENKIKVKNKMLFKTKYIWGIIIVIVMISIGIIGFKKYTDDKNFNFNIAKAEKNYKHDKFDEAKKYYKLATNYSKNSNVQSKIKLCDDVQNSYEEYKKGNELMNKKDYIGAYNAFKEVIIEDKKRYDICKNKINESKKLFIDGELIKANDLANKKEYDNAIVHINLILDIDANNQNAKELKEKYQSDLQKKINEQKKIEEEKSRQEEIKNVKNTIKITSAWPSNPNSANGVDLNIIWKNTSNKTIKYVMFDVVPYNAVGDPQQCDIRNSISFRGKVTGPIYQGQTEGENTFWECAWYNSTIVSVKIKGITITYMDGSNVSLDQKQIQYAY